MRFIRELKWRGMVHNMTPGIEDLFRKGPVTGYVGIDPTAGSLHIGHLVSVIMLRHFQLHGHNPVILIGGATGMIGDPSGKSEERKLLSEQELRDNQNVIKKQLQKYLQFDSVSNPAVMVNNYDWLKQFSLLEFLRDVGKHLTINYMMAKDSVQKRLETGISFTEFTYQLAQGYDFYHLYKVKNCRLQIGGSDQWGNITTGTELIRRMSNGEAHALTCPLLTKPDGSKFGKTEKGNIWLDPELTSPYAFYQFWLNTSDEEAGKLARIFTFRDQEEIKALEIQHAEAPHKRILQNTLASDLTLFIHGEDELNKARDASRILFGKSTSRRLSELDENTLLSAMEGVPQYNLTGDKLSGGINLIDLLAIETSILPSKNEARKMIKGNGISINKEKQNNPDHVVSKDDLINDRYILIQKGKKNYHLLIVE